MKPVLLCDFGSTWTKLTAVDLAAAEVLGTAAAYTTVEQGIEVGFEHALQELNGRIGQLTYQEQLACSSAAGGLRMIVSGLVPELTAEAARLAALGAGAKVIRIFSHEMTEEDLAEIVMLKPDIFLLTGGTDGGNSDCIIANATWLSTLRPDFPIVIAGNRSANRRIKEILADYDLTFCPNVMPQLQQINIEPVQAVIREIFLRRIIQAKGMSQVQELISNIMLPTPAAMLKAMRLLADGYAEQSGIGDLVAVDLGGATTDVYSICSGMPQRMNVVIKGLPEPRDKRTVEGDIGMRYSLRGIVDEHGYSKIAGLAQIEATQIEKMIERLIREKDSLPDDHQWRRLELALATLAVETALTRHAGSLTEVYTPMGQTFLQTGKDLRPVENLILTGGALIHSESIVPIAAAACYRADQPMILKPERVSVSVDRNYILSAMGVLAQSHPLIACEIMKKELQHERSEE